MTKARKRYSNFILFFSMFAVCGSISSSASILGEPQFWGFQNDYGVVAGDFDLDGDIDLFSVHLPVRDSFGQLIEPGRFHMNLNTQGVGWFSPQLISSSMGAFGVFTGDFNGDGILDIVDDDLAVMLGNGDGTFGPIIQYTNGNNTGRAVGIGDMDGDGDLDLIIPNGGPVLLNSGDGSFYTNFINGDVFNGIAIAIGDVNQDGNLDIATIDGHSPHVNLQLGLGDGDGNPGPPLEIPTFEMQPADVILIDMNRDGFLDLVTLNDQSENISVLLGNGDASFQSPMSYMPHEPANFNVEVFQVADLTGDGAPEVIVTSTVFGAATSHQETGILRNDGAGNLVLEQTIERFGQLGENIVVGDFDGNGSPDLATATDLLLNQTVIVPCRGDITGQAGNPDGMVDLMDLAAVTLMWSQACMQCPEDIEGSDNQVNIRDLITVVETMGACQ